MTPQALAVVVVDNKVPDSLADLAARINAEHEAAVSFWRQSLERAIDCGTLLIAAKNKVADMHGGRSHGHWSPWLKENCRFSERSAQAYMRIALHAHELKSADSADLSIDAALKLLAEPRFTGNSDPVEAAIANADKLAKQRAGDGDDFNYATANHHCVRDFVARTIGLLWRWQFYRMNPQQRRRLFRHLRDALNFLEREGMPWLGGECELGEALEKAKTIEEMAQLCKISDGLVRAFRSNGGGAP